MAKRYDIQFVKTYASAKNAEAAVAKVLGPNHADDLSLTYSVVPTLTEDRGVRFGVVFFGQDAVRRGLQFHFNVVAL